MNETKSQRIYTRVTQREKEKIKTLAAKCGLSESEYMRKRALGFSPKEIPPDAFFVFSSRLDELCSLCAGRITPDTERMLIETAQAIQAAFLSPEKESVWQIKAGLKGGDG